MFGVEFETLCLAWMPTLYNSFAVEYFSMLKANGSESPIQILDYSLPCFMASSPNFFWISFTAISN